jgi:transposase
MVAASILIGVCLLAVVPAGGLMVDPPEVLEIFRLKRELGWGTDRIAEHLGISRNTVKRYLKLGKYQPYTRAPRPDPLGELRAWAEQRFLEVSGNVRVLHRELLQRHFEIGYSTLARALQPLRARLAALERATVRFETPPGQQLQADFGELFVRIAGMRTKVHFGVLTLGYSRRCFVKAFLSERQEQWLSTFEEGFHHFGGVPLELLLDNARALVKEHDTQTGQVTFTEPLLSFCALHGIKPRACRPFRARTKGKVESGVKYLKRNALAGQSFESFEALEAYLQQWVREVADVRIHGTTHERPMDRFAAEARALQPLRISRALPLPKQRKVASDALIDLDTNRYSVPAEYVGRSVEVRSEAGMVAVRCDGHEIARHAELRGRHQCSMQPEHVSGLHSRAEPLPLEPPEAANDVLRPYAELGGES